MPLSIQVRWVKDKGAWESSKVQSSLQWQGCVLTVRLHGLPVKPNLTVVRAASVLLRIKWGDLCCPLKNYIQHIGIQRKKNKFSGHPSSLQSQSNCLQEQTGTKKILELAPHLPSLHLPLLPNSFSIYKLYGYRWLYMTIKKPQKGDFRVMEPSGYWSWEFP